MFGVEADFPSYQILALEYQPLIQRPYIHWLGSWLYPAYVSLFPRF